MKKLILVIAIALTSVPPVHAAPATPATPAASAMSDGVVRKIDAPNGKITLKHGPIANLDMPGMTMVFRVQSPALLKSLKPGDAVKFHAESIDGALTVTAIQVAK
ncbi:MAG: RND transporter [Thiobacillus sp.]|nr:RND transporter [Thiobacillus sp.]